MFNEKVVSDSTRGGGPLRRRVLVFALGFGLIWAAFYVVHTSFPFIKAGAALVYEHKVERLVEQADYFDDTQSNRVVIFGNSKVLTGFDPTVFDRSRAATQSVNLGLPDLDRFVIEFLETLVERGQVPTHVVFTTAWPAEFEGGSLFNPFGHDLASLFDELFPFRDLPRNVLNFVSRARHRGGLRAYYEEGRRDIEQMLEQRGYYYIAADALFDDARLPADYTIAGDTPDAPIPASRFIFGGPVYERLLRIADENDIRLVVLPVYIRPQQFIPNPIEDRTNLAGRETADGVVVAPASMVTIDEAYFSDAQHLNPEGAERYTQFVADFFTANKLWR